MAAVTRRLSLTGRLTLASSAAVVAVGLVCAVGLLWLRDLEGSTRASVEREMASLDETSVFEALLYQKGFVADYMLTGDRRWLDRLAQSQASFAGWLARARDAAAKGPRRVLVDEVGRISREVDERREIIVSTFDAGRHDEAHGLLALNHAPIERLRALAGDMRRQARAEALGALAERELSMRRLAWLLVGASLAGALSSLVAGFLLARRVARPIYELQLRVGSEVARRRMTVSPSAEGLGALGDQVSALVARLEEADAVLVEQRRRLAQSEKLSAIGELAAKLAHEVLNPLAGMKVAVQLMQRAPGDAASVRESAEALEREVRRVEALVRRLVDYSRPLALHVEAVAPVQIVDAALDAAAPELSRRRAAVARTDARDLPPLEADRMLLTQVLVNLLANAAQAMPDGGPVEVGTARATDLGREHVVFRVADRGVGLEAAQLPQLFQPFYTTRPDGHGLGLAVSHNIVVEHGGRIAAAAREGGGAVFEVWIPIVR